MPTLLHKGSIYIYDAVFISSAPYDETRASTTGKKLMLAGSEETLHGCTCRSRLQSKRRPQDLQNSQVRQFLRTAELQRRQQLKSASMRQANINVLQVQLTVGNCSIILQIANNQRGSDYPSNHGKCMLQTHDCCHKEGQWLVCWEERWTLVNLLQTPWPLRLQTNKTKLEFLRCRMQGQVMRFVKVTRAIDG